MTASPPPEIILEHFQWSLKRMEEILRQEKTDYYRDASLQRFGFTVDLASKCIGAFAAGEGKTCASPKDSFQLASEYRWLGGEVNWEAMVDDYELIQSKPTDGSGDRVYSELDQYYAWLNHLHAKLSEV